MWHSGLYCLKWLFPRIKCCFKTQHLCSRSSFLLMHPRRQRWWLWFVCMSHTCEFGWDTWSQSGLVLAAVDIGEMGHQTEDLFPSLCFLSRWNKIKNAYEDRDRNLNLVSRHLECYLMNTFIILYSFSKLYDVCHK